MKLLRDSVLLRALCQWLASRRTPARATFTVTVPAPLERSPLPQPAASNVITLEGRTATGARAPMAPRPGANAPTSARPLALVSSR